MKRLLLIGLLALLVVGTAIAAWAQEDGNFVELPTGCEPDNMAAMEAASPVVSFATACETYLACRSNGSSNCDWPVASILLDACEPDDRICRIVSLLHVADLAMHQPPYDDPGLVRWESFKAPLLPEAIRLISSGEYDAAAELYGSPYDLGFGHEMEYYAAGLIAEMRGLPDDALAAYDAAENIDPYRTLVLVTRAQLLRNLGRTTEASLDAARLAGNLIPFEPSQSSAWLAYPVINRWSDEGGDTFYDLTQREPVSVQVAYYLQEMKFAVSGLPSFSGGGLQVLSRVWTPSQFFLDRPLSDLAFVNGFQPADHYRAPGNEINLYLHPTAIIARTGQGTYLLRPEGAADIRPDFGARICEGGVISRLKPGMRYIRSGRSGVLRLSDEPAERNLTDRRAFAGTVLDRDPVCVGSSLWWFVQDDESSTGWLAENEGNMYLLNPMNPNNSGFLYCPTAPESRLFAGATVRLTADSQTLVYVDPGFNSRWLTDVEPGAILEVVSNPECTNGRVWWGLRVGDDLIGYMPEGDADTYFLEPVPFTP